MEDLFARIVLGHLVGDYLFQTKRMALKKAENTLEGLTLCFVHCFIYTASVCLFLWTLNPLLIVLVFITHFVFDGFSLGSKWMKLIKSRDIFAAYCSKEEYHEIDLAFSCLVYAVTDNTFHLIILWLVTWLVTKVI